MLKLTHKTFLILLFVISTSMLFVGCTNPLNFFKANNQNNNQQNILNNQINPNQVTPVPSESPLPEKSQEMQVPKRIKTPKVKAVYLTGWSAGNKSKLENIIQLSKTTELNSVVIDIKDDDGKVGYETSLKDVRDIRAWEKKFNVDEVIKILHQNNIYVIGRIVCFKDPILPNARNDLAYKNKHGGVWRDRLGRAWVNPLNKDSWNYIIDIAKEAADKGFDEIQYDYIRFPNGGDGGDVRQIDFGPGFDPSSKSDVIAEFLKKSMTEVHDAKGIPLSADLFAIAATGTADDNTLGQNWEKLAKEVDYLCPMIYPSHFALGQTIRDTRFSKPDLEPYKVVYETLMVGKGRLEKSEHKAKIRAYLQAFNAPWIGAGNWQKYGVSQIRDQIKAVYDAGYEEWILWDPNNAYSNEIFDKKQ